MTTLFLALAFATGTTGDTSTSTDTGVSTSAPADTGSADTGVSTPTPTDPGSPTSEAMGDTAPVTAAGLAAETGGLGCDVGRRSVRLGVLAVLVLLFRRRGATAGGAA